MIDTNSLAERRGHFLLVSSGISLTSQPKKKKFITCPVAFICSLNDPVPSKFSCQWLISDHKYQLLLIVERVLLYTKKSKLLVVATSAPYRQNLEPSEKDRTQQLVFVIVKSSLLATIFPQSYFVIVTRCMVLENL